MYTTTVSSKGQITLPAALVRQQHIEPGTQLYVVPTSAGILLVPVVGPLADRLAGSTGGHYGEPNAYVTAERAAWTSEA